MCSTSWEIVSQSKHICSVYRIHSDTFGNEYGEGSLNSIFFQMLHFLFVNSIPMLREQRINDRPHSFFSRKNKSPIAQKMRLHC